MTYPETDYRLGQQRTGRGWDGLQNQNAEYQQQRYSAYAKSMAQAARNQEQASYHAMYGSGLGAGQQRTYSPPPAIAPPPNHWSVILGVSAKATISEIKVAYRRLAGTAHPDHGGSSDAMAKLNDARDRALRERKAA